MVKKKSNIRENLKVHPDFKKMVDILQNELNIQRIKKGQKKLSSVDVTLEMLPEIKNIEKKLLEGDTTIRIKVKMDKNRGEII